MNTEKDVIFSRKQELSHNQIDSYYDNVKKFVTVYASLDSNNNDNLPYQFQSIVRHLFLTKRIYNN